jgi:hypothetical protein
VHKRRKNRQTPPTPSGSARSPLRPPGGGNPYRIDVLPGMESSANPKIMRRSIGAMVFHDESFEDPATSEPFYRTLQP